MGIAKQKGTYEQRVAFAIESQKQYDKEMQEHIDKLSEFEAQSEEMRVEGITNLIKYHLATEKRQYNSPLMDVDWNLVEGFKKGNFPTLTGGFV